MLLRNTGPKGLAGAVAALLASVALAACTHAEPPPVVRPTSNGPVAEPATQPAGLPSPRFAKIAAEAADGLRGEPVYVVVTPDHHPHVFQDSASALGFAEEAGGHYFGGFFTPDETRPELGRIVEVNVVIRYPDGRESRSTLPDSADAFFWSLAAYDKFVHPYYERLHGSAFANEMRSRFTNSDAYVMAFCHDLKSIECAFGR
jgi:hypothetical protein